MIDEFYSFEKTIKATNKSMTRFPGDASDAMAYVPFQNNDTLYSKEQGFVLGTMFTVLNKPFKGCGTK
ncbi:MAG: spore coat associated protein CotJA [Acutalibacteraceae bacterium]|nr:spore coat associated protein CotJA [Acutalibacteraceae bacterium]